MSRGPRRRPGPALLALALGVLLAPFGAIPGAGVGRTEAPATASPIGTDAAHVAGSGPLSPAAILSGFGEVMVNSTDPSLVPNDGLRANLTGFQVEPFPALSKFQIGVEESLGAYYVAFGLFQNSPVGPYAFFSVFNNTTAQPVFGSNESGVAPVVGGAYDFELTRANGTNWSLTLNGHPFAGGGNASTFDFRVRSGDDLPSIGLSQVAFAAGPVVPARVEIPTSFAVRTQGTWRLPAVAVTGYLGDPRIRWGTGGAAQDPSLFPGMVELGTAVAAVPNGTAVWSGGPVAGRFTLSADPTRVWGSGTALLLGSVATAAGQPLPDFPLALSDAFASRLSEPLPSSDPNGSIRVGLFGPNVTAAANDTVRLVSRAMGLSGSATSVIQLLPAIPVRFSVDAPAPIRPRSNVTLTVSARLLNGSPAQGVPVTLYTLGGGSVAPEAGLTDAAGTVRVLFSAPPGDAVVRLVVGVTAGAFWGLESFDLRVAPPPPSLLVVVLPYVAAALSLGLIAAGIIVLWRRRPPRQPLRPMVLSPPPGETPAPSPPAGSPLSRTPPSGGTP